MVTVNNDDVTAKEVVSCKIPILDPNHPQLSTLIKDLGTNLANICSKYEHKPLFQLVNNTFELRTGVDKKRISNDSMKLKEIVRENDFSISYNDLENPFHGKQGLQRSNDLGKSEFIRFDYTVDDKKMSDYYARVIPKNDILRKQMEIRNRLTNTGISTNILIIGMETTSRANVERKLPCVLSYLKTHLNTYFLNGMSIVGDATTPALTAALTGKKLSELSEARRSHPNGRHIDKWPWVIKEYEKQGYMTLFAEDDPYLGAFNLRLHGFKEVPVHHYLRPFWIALEKNDQLREKDLCYKSGSVTNITLKYILDFYEAYPTARKFAFGYMCYLTHGRSNRLSYLEDDLLWFLKAFVSRGYHKDTTVILMGDHGSRTSAFRSTMQGKLEERLPMFSISLPSFFYQNFPELALNLGSNRDIIASQFDIHATLRHILTYPIVTRGNYSQSLLEKLPRNRTCADAGIDEHFCVCLNWIPINITSEKVQKFALSVVNYINSELSTINEVAQLCHSLKLGNILFAYKLDVSSMKFTNKKASGDPRYQITIVTQPNDGMYEATVSMSAEGNVRINKEISRINRYNDAPKCIANKYPQLRKYCYCKSHFIGS